MLPSTLDMVPSPSTWNPRPSTLDPRQKDRLLWEQLKLAFPGKAIYHWLNGDYPVTIMSTTHHARVMRVEAFVIAWTR